MTRNVMPSEVLDYNDLPEGPCGKNVVQLSQSLAFPPDIVDFQNSIISRHSHESILTYLNLINYRVNRLDLLCEGYIDIIFIFEGISSLKIKDLSSQYGQNDVMMIINARQFSIVKPAGSKKRGIHFKIRPAVLIDEYGLCIDLLPDHVRAAILGLSREPLTLKAALPPRSKVILIDVYECKMQGTLFHKYMHARAEELICEFVQSLNMIYQSKQNDMMVSYHEKHRQAIEAAARIYRQRMGQAPPNAELARMLGLNRNNFNEGFKKFYNLSPAEYKREQILGWAREQLEKGLRSVKEIAILAGYSGISSFSRSYADHFGIAPSAAKPSRTGVLSGQEPTEPASDEKSPA